MSEERGLSSTICLRFLFVLMALINTSPVFATPIGATTFIEEAMLVRKTNKLARIDISYIAEAYFPLGESEEFARQRMAQYGLVVWKDNPKIKGIIGSYEPKARLLTYDEYRVVIDLNDARKTARVRAWILFHSF